MSREVVITGVGAVTPLGRRRPHAARALARRRRPASRTARAPRPSSSPPSTSRSRRRAARTASPSSRWSPRDEALRRGRLERRAAVRRRRGSRCILGTGIGGIGTLERGKRAADRAGRRRRSRRSSVPLMMSNAGAGRACPCATSCAATSLRHRLRLRGGRARDRRRRADDPVRRRRRGRHRRLGGGAHAAVHAPRSRALDALSRQRHLAPVRRPPRRLRDGRGRRACSCSRTPRRPRERGATILGTVRGYGATSDALPPDRARQGRRGRRRRRCARALEDAGITPGGRRLRQRPRHLDAAQRPRRDARRSRRRSATTPTRSRSPRPKSAIGHLLGAAGAVEAVATILALRDRIAPPTLGLRGARGGPGPRLRARTRPARCDIDGKPRRSRSRTRSASAATTPCCAWRPHDRRAASAEAATSGSRPIERLEALCDQGSLTLLRSRRALAPHGRARRAPATA